MIISKKSKLSSMELEDSTRRIWWCGSGVVAAEMAAAEMTAEMKMAVLLRHHLRS